MRAQSACKGVCCSRTTTRYCHSMQDADGKVVADRQGDAGVCPTSRSRRCPWSASRWGRAAEARMSCLFTRCRRSTVSRMCSPDSGNTTASRDAGNRQGRQQRSRGRQSRRRNGGCGDHHGGHHFRRRRRPRDLHGCEWLDRNSDRRSSRLVCGEAKRACPLRPRIRPPIAIRSR